MPFVVGSNPTIPTNKKRDKLIINLKPKAMIKFLKKAVVKTFNSNMLTPTGMIPVSISD